MSRYLKIQKVPSKAKHGKNVPHRTSNQTRRSFPTTKVQITQR
jgi:hypothetical protein